MWLLLYNIEKQKEKSIYENRKYKTMKQTTKSGIIILLLFTLAGYYMIYEEMYEDEHVPENMVERMFYQRYNTEKYSFNPYDSYYSTLEMTFIIICYGYALGEFLILLKHLKITKII
jgi:hypothetical protein